MAVAARRHGARPRRQRLPGWTLVGVAAALLVAAPLIVLPLSFVGEASALDQIAATLLPDALVASLVLAGGVGAGTLVLGGGMAVLVSFYDFPGRRWLDWALVLPLAMPAYVLVFVLLGQYDYASPLQQGLRDLFGPGFALPPLRSTGGTILVLTLVLYPYVYVLGRSAFLGQSRASIEAARSLGATYWQAIRRVALPLARPALAGGVALAVMEALADFGAVNLLGYRALTDAIYRVWFGAFDQAAALQLATVLVGLTLTLIALERLLRGRARYHQSLARGEAVTPRRLPGPAGVAAAAIPVLVLLVAVAGPILQLGVWSIESLAAGTISADLGTTAANSLLLSLVAALIGVAAATVIVYGLRAAPSRTGAVSARVASLGYALPGTVVAVAVFVPLSWLEHRLDEGLASVLGSGPGLLLTGTVIGVIVAYLVRFQALALFAVDARMTRIDPRLDDAARALGAGRSRVLADVHVPLLWPGILTAALLVFVEVMKELPATALLRPLGGDTLAVAVWEATKDSRFETAALPALLIVLIGLVPVIMLIRLSRRGTWTAGAGLAAGEDDQPPR